MILHFKTCAIRILNPTALALKKAGFQLLRLERDFPLVTPKPEMNVQISSDDYTMPRYLFNKLRRLIRQDTRESYLEAAKILFQIVLSAFAYSNPDKIGRVQSIKFTILTLDKKHDGIQYDLTDFINDLIGRNVVTLRSLHKLSKPVNKRNMTLLVTFFDKSEEDHVDPWEDLGYTR